MARLSDLRTRIEGIRRQGIRRLREAVDLIREDSWSPRESKLRCLIVRAGLPEPVLNQDIYDDHGRFLGCVDLAYPDKKVAIEYHGLMHACTYAADVVRIAAPFTPGARTRVALFVVLSPETGGECDLSIEVF